MRFHSTKFVLASAALCLIVLGFTRMPVTVTAQGVGSPCAQIGGPGCGPGLACVAGGLNGAGTCQSIVGANVPCDPTNPNSCDPGFRCAVGNNPAIGRCKPNADCIQPSGSICRLGGIPCCPSTFCNGQTCQNLPNLNPPFSSPTQTSAGIRLLEPINGVTEIPTNPAINGVQSPLNPFYYYYNLLWPLIIGMAAAIAVLNGLIGGIQYMAAGADEGAAGAGKKRLIFSLGGLVLLLLTALILNTLNPTFFKLS